MRAVLFLISVFTLLVYCCRTVSGRQTSRSEVIVRGTRTWTAKKRTTSIALGPCGVPAGTTFQLLATNGPFVGQYISSESRPSGVDVGYFQESGMVFMLNAACNLVLTDSGEFASVHSGSTTLSQFNFATGDKISSGGYDALTCNVANSELSCAYQTVNTIVACPVEGDLLFIGSMPINPGCDSVTLAVQLQ